MIRINLIPREKRKARPLFLYLFLGLLGLNLSLVGTIYYRGKAAIDEYQRRIEEKKRQIESLEPVYKEFLAIEKARAEISKRIEILEKLQEGRALAVRILQDIARAKEEPVWLKEMKKQQDRVQIQGFSNQTESISDFAEALGKIPYVKGVELKNIQEVQELGLTVKKFSVELLLGS